MTTGKPAPSGTARYGRATDIEGFEQIDLLWEGSITRVVKARQLSNGQLVTLKVVDPNRCEEGEVEEFLASAGRSTALTHPNLVRVLQTGTSPTSKLAYVVQEFVEGNSLEVLLEEEGKLSETDALAVVQAIAEALAYAEDHGVTHGNLKPENVMVDADGTTRLMDLGVFKPVGKGDSVAVPSPHYIAPEQALDLEVDIRADLYALGIILFRLLTGKFPFTGRTFSELTNQHINEDVPDPREFEPNISDHLSDVICWLCARDPGKRYTSARSAALDLVRLMAGRNPLGPSGSGAQPRDTAALPRTLVPGVDLEAYEEKLETHGDETPPAWTSTCPYQVKLSSRGVTLAEYNFDEDVITIGRSKEAAIHIDNPIVSRRHAQIRRLGTKFVVVPLSSTNATSVNGERVREQTDVALGDLIVLSDKFHVDLTWDVEKAKQVRRQPASEDPDAETSQWNQEPVEEDDDKTPAVARKRPVLESDPPGGGYEAKPTEPVARYEAPETTPALVSVDDLDDQSKSLYGPRDMTPTQPTPRVRLDRGPPAAASDSGILAWSAPRGYLIFARGGAQVRSFVDKAFQVGSSHACDLRLGRDAPRKAALIVRCSDGYRLFNVGPNYDTVSLNGEPVPDHAVLEDGDELAVVGVPLVFSVDAPTPSP